MNFTMNESLTSAPIYGLILAGGKSSRMGYDKSTIDYHGKPQRQYLFDELAKLCNKVFVSCRKSHQVPDHLNPLIDRFNIESPLNGILTAMTYDPSVAWFVVAADMPMVTTASLEYLLQHRNREKVATCFIDSDLTKPEPLFSIWEPRAFQLVKYFYEKGKISPRDFLMQSDILLVKPPVGNVSVNINSPEELERFKRGTTVSGE
jgi:molybdopterin-guanine dinucleotide biosynthesis protein A